MDWISVLTLADLRVNLDLAEMVSPPNVVMRGEPTTPVEPM